ncbi:MAG TPA: CBS domain-containing protein [Anaeromyxobacteraceae bacterium]|nr:CBS domain-containing protein [Anaeromyxobacteraceae bacterium]
MASISKHVTRDVIALEASTPSRDAARLMTDRQIGSVAVREAGKITGLVTERDLVIAVVARGGDGSLPIREAMRRDVPRIGAESTEADASNLMRENYTRHLLVEEQGKVIGIISMRDIIQLMLDEKQYVIEQLHTYISGV